MSKNSKPDEKLDLEEKIALKQLETYIAKDATAPTREQLLAVFDGIYFTHGSAIQNAEALAIVLGLGPKTP